jgi:hypothetical protein
MGLDSYMNGGEPWQPMGDRGRSLSQARVNDTPTYDGSVYLVGFKTKGPTHVVVLNWRVGKIWSCIFG